MLVAYKTEILPNEGQKEKIKQTIGVARYVKNLYIAHTREVYKEGGSFISGRDFSKWLNNTYVRGNPDKNWIKDVSTKAVKQAIMETETAFKRFFKGFFGFPKFKKKNAQDVTMYFVKNDRKTIIICERHRIKVPTLGWVKLKEKGYIPTHDVNHTIRSGKISRQADRFYISVLVEQDCKQELLNERRAEGIRIDLGLKDFAVVSGGKTYKNINKPGKIRKLEKQLKRQQSRLSRKYVKCGYTADRDYNASMNLKDAKKHKVIA